MNRSRTFLFMPESAYGPTNNCIGIANVLRERGHRIVFAAERSWEGKLDALGFEEDLVDLAPAPTEPDPAEPDMDGGETNVGEPDAGQFWIDFIRDTAPEFRKPTIEQLATFIQPTWQALIDGAKYCEPQLREIIDRAHPDVIIEDNVVGFPALVTARAPYVRIMSCNPLEIGGPDVPPTFSGYAVADRTGWDAFRHEYDRTHREMWLDYDEWVRSCGAPGLTDLHFIHASEHLNLSLYPEAIDYTDLRPLDATWHRLDSSVRTTDEPFELPEHLRDSHGALIYLSLGSLGSADVDLMRRLVDVLSSLPHRFIVSKGPQHHLYELADNMWGAPTVPQTNVIPLVDLVITHGGNNTTTESFHFGKPMIALPLFWDQYDNAQRVAETGYGIRLDTYRFSDEEMAEAIDRLLADAELRQRTAALGATIRSRAGTRVAADLLDRLAGTLVP